MKNRIILLLVTLLALAGTATAQSASRPVLVVNIVVGSFRYDYLQRFSDGFGLDGLRRMIREGTLCTSANYTYLNTNAVAGIATIMTGANPDAHGIISERWVDFTTNKIVTLAEDPQYAAVGGDDENKGRISPRNLVATNLSDQLKRYNASSKVLSIALRASDAVVAAGRGADAAYWFDDFKGQWLTSSYYQKQIPAWISEFSRPQSLGQYMRRDWERLLAANQYVSQKVTLKGQIPLVGGLVDRIFSKGEDSFTSLTVSPYGIDMMFDFARRAVEHESLGRDNDCDMLTLHLEPFTNITEKFGPESMEVEDAVYRLDRALGSFVRYLETRMDKNKILILFTSDHGSSDKTEDNSRQVGGFFNATQFKAIVSGFLNAQLGTGDWVTDYHDHQLYLNRRLIYEKGLNLADIQNRLATFAIQFSGVSHAMTAVSLQAASFEKGVAEQMQNSYFPRRSGDLIINLLPGWIEQSEGCVSTSGSPYRYDTHVPLLFWGAGVRRGESVSRSVDMRDVASTMAALLGIPIPESASGTLINEMIR